MNLIYFSPCNSTKSVVQLIASQWDEEIHEYDLSLDIQDCQIANEITIIGVPSYAGRVAKIAVERLQHIKACDTPVILVVCYGNRAYEDTLLELKDIATQVGFRAIAAISAVCEHSIMHDFAKGRPNVQDKEELKGFAQQIKHQEQSRDKQLLVDGNFPYRAYGGLPLHPKTNKNCTACGLCISMCPVHAISFDKKVQTDTSICISCMRCVQQCHQQARNVSSLLVKAATKKLAKQCLEPKKNTLFLLR